MHLMYVDESGDPGFHPQSSERYVRVGVVVHGWRWQSVDERITRFKITHGLTWKDEIRASDIRRRAGAFAKWKPIERAEFRVNLLDTIGRECDELSVFGICIHKHLVDQNRKERLSNPSVRSMELLLEAFNRFLQGQRDKCGIVILDECEASHDENLRYFQNYLRRFSNAIDERRIVEGTMFLSSNSSNMLQIADVCANTLLRRYRWTEEATAEFARIEHKFIVKEWPRTVYKSSGQGGSNPTSR